MSLSRKSASGDASEPVDGVFTDQPLPTHRLAAARGDTKSPIETRSKTTAAPSTTADRSGPADLAGDNPMAFYPSAGLPSEALRPSLVDAVIEQLRHARLKRQRPH